jgi:hypothetical protein
MVGRGLGGFRVGETDLGRPKYYTIQKLVIVRDETGCGDAREVFEVIGGVCSSWEVGLVSPLPRSADTLSNGKMKRNSSDNSLQRLQLLFQSMYGLRLQTTTAPGRQVPDSFAVTTTGTLPAPAAHCCCLDIFSLE